MSDAGTAIFNHDITLGDNSIIKVGAGPDLQIYHDTTNTIVSNTTGDLILQGNANILLKRETGGGATMLKAVVDGAVELYHDNTKKLETIAAGVRIPSGGLLFDTDTAAANALNDYEEGTFTPAIQTAPSGVSLGTVNHANYTKIGQIVHISMSIILSSSNNPGTDADMRLSGFPFTFADAEVSHPATLHANHKVTPQLHMNGGRYLYYQNPTEGGNNQNPIGLGLDASSYLSLAIVYRTAQ